jgi:hypothetical protein
MREMRDSKIWLIWHQKAVSNVPKFHTYKGIFGEEFREYYFYIHWFFTGICSV